MRIEAIRTLFAWGQSVQDLMKTFGLTESAIQKNVHDLRSREELWGCTREQYLILLKNGVTEKFRDQKSGAKTRGIGWELNLWQWWTTWQDSGHWDKRGGGQGYVMCRRGDIGPYAVGNIFIDTNRKNVSDGHKIKDLPLGVSEQKGRYYIASRRIDGAVHYLGSHPTPELAHAAYLACEPKRGPRA